MCIFIYEYARACLYVFMCVGTFREKMKERERERQKDRQRERDREIEIERENEREEVCLYECVHVFLFFANDKNNMKNRNTVKTNQQTHKATKIKP